MRFECTCWCLNCRDIADLSQSIPSSEVVINQAAARRLNRKNQKAKKALAATSTEGTPERLTESGKRIHAADGGSPTSTHPTKKARLDSTVHLQELQSAAEPVEPSLHDRNEVIDSIALADADIDEGTIGAEVVNAVLAAEEAGLEQVLAEVTRDEDTTMD